MGKEITLYEPMSADENERINRRRWRRHRIATLPTGITFVQEGRSGSFYFRTGQYVVELEAELAGTAQTDITINREGYANMIDLLTLQQSPAIPQAARDAQQALEAWLAERCWRFIYFP
jgi:hypothetical protein